MTDYRRNFTPGGAYFFTLNLVDRRSSLLTENISRLRSAFRYTRVRYPFETVAIVVLPDHMHALWRLPEDDADFSTRWRLKIRLLAFVCGERRNIVKPPQQRRTRYLAASLLGAYDPR